VKAGSGATTLGSRTPRACSPISWPTPADPYNDPGALEELLAKNADIAAFILEPVMGNIGPVLPDGRYLSEVRKITRDHDVLLIFDEVITGYRIGIGGAQGYFGVKPDISTFGKIIGGGLPIGAFAGRREIMDLVAPQGPVYQAGTFSGNPLSLAAGVATMRWLKENPHIYRTFEEQTAAIADGIPAKAPGSFVRLGSMFKYFFRSEPPRNYTEVKECDTTAFRSLWDGMLGAGIFVPPSQFETNFLSAVHTDGDIEKIAGAYTTCL
jgi:glutamate-1-semialdehyde 2,1-aminomutase